MVATMARCRAPSIGTASARSSRPDPGCLGGRQDEELGQLADAVAYDGAGVSEGMTGRIAFSEPPCISGRGQVLEQWPTEFPLGRWLSGGRVGTTSGATAEVVDRRHDDVVREP